MSLGLLLLQLILNKQALGVMSGGEYAPSFLRKNVKIFYVIYDPA